MIRSLITRIPVRPRQAGVVVVVVGLVGCNAIFGLEEVEPLEDEDGSTTTTAASTTSAGGTGVGGAGTGGTGGQPSAGGGATTSSAGGGGGTPAVCDASTLGTALGCENGFKCSMSSAQNGVPACVAAGTYPAWSRCNVDGQCAVGTWCDEVRGVCKPVCNNASCAGNGNCIAAPDGNGGSVGNLQVCTADCEPIGATPCNQSQGNVNCVRTPSGLDCMASGAAAKYQSCVTDYQCAPGLMCYSGSYCDSWCTIGGNDCAGACVSVSPNVFSNDNNTEYGICGPS